MKHTLYFSALVLTVLFTSCSSNCDNCVTQSQLRQAIDSLKQINTVAVESVNYSKKDSFSNNDVFIRLDEATCRRYLSLIRVYSNKLSLWDTSKIWMNGTGSIGTRMNHIGNKLYEFYVSPEDEFHRSEIWFRSITFRKNSENDFPRERVYFEYKHSEKKGYLVSRLYQTAGQGYPEYNAESVKERFERMLTIADKMVK